MSKKTTPTPSSPKAGKAEKKVSPRRANTWLENTRMLDATGRQLERDMAPVHAESKAYARLYYSRVTAEREIDYDRPYRESNVYDELRKTGGNLSREIVDGALALICRPLKPEIIPIGKDFELQMGCEQAEMLIEGVFRNSKFLQVATLVARDGATTHIGVGKGYVDEGRNEIRFERLNPFEVYWPDDGTDYPRVVMHIAGVPRDNLIARYPDHEEEIVQLPPYRRRNIIGVDPWSRRNQSDLVRVTEAWALELGEGAPGKHAVVTGNLTLEEEEWPYDIHPLFFFRWSPDFDGLSGVPLTRIVGPYDCNNRRLGKRVYDGLAGAVPFVKTTGNVDAVDLPTDVPFNHIHVDKGATVEIEMPRQVVSGEVIAEMGRNRERAFQESGVNQQAVAGAAPTSLTSGKAQETWIDIVNTRLLPAQVTWQDTWSQAGKIVVLLAQHAKSVNVRIQGADYYDTVAWPDIDKDKYHVEFGLSSGLGLTVSARFQNLERLFNAGAIDMPELLRGLEIPDTQDVSDRVNAPRDLVHQIITRALKHAVFTMPSAMQGEVGLRALVDLGGQEFQRAMVRGNVPKKNLECLRRVIMAAKSRLEPPPAPPPAEEQVAAPGREAAPPGAVPPDAGPPEGLPPEAMPPEAGGPPVMPQPPPAAIAAA